MQARTTSEVTRCVSYLSQWKDSVNFWERMGDAEFAAQLANARKQVRRWQTKLQWANQRAALYTVR